MDEFVENAPAELEQTGEQAAACLNPAQPEQTGCANCCGCCQMPEQVLPAAAQAEIETITTPQVSAPESGELPVTVVDIHFRSGGKVYFFDPGELRLSPGDHVIIDTARGPEYGYCSSGNHRVPARDVVAPLRKVLRVATEADEKTAAENRQKEKKAFAVCQQKIQEHKLEMQLVSAEYAFDGSKILFFFTADSRVDFRELVKSLASVFRTRIELRQIGVRDKAKMVGGLGICGRPFCCSEFLEDFQPVSIKMAKVQNLSLNPTKISGTCGRLMCCLKYEQDAYEDLLRNCPKVESFVDTPDGRGTVCEVNLLRQSVRVRMEEHPETIGTYQTEDICVFRNGKAKRNDMPIPRDWAPVSGSGVRRKPAPEEQYPALEDVIIKSEPYEPSQGMEQSDTARTAGGQRRRRRGGQDRHPGEQAQTRPRPAEHTDGERPAGEKTATHRRRRGRGKPKGEGECPPAQAAPATNKPANVNRRPRRRRNRSGAKPPEGGSANT